jgi:hypothetical protein
MVDALIYAVGVLSVFVVCLLADIERLKRELNRRA